MMKQIKLLTVLLIVLANVSLASNNTSDNETHTLKRETATQLKQHDTFALGNRTFLVNDKPFVIRAAEIHYPRIPKDYWEHRIEMCKAMGMNTICLYVFWNFHEQEMGKFNFKGQHDIREFCELAQKHGMYVIIRPGPYVCAEWDMGGLPWWLLKKKDIKVRTKDDKFYMDRVDIFMKEVGKELSPMTLNKGGNIIMVQVENEYPAFGDDKQYMELIKESVINAGFDDVQLFSCAWSSNFKSTMLDDVLCTINFGAGSNIDNQFKELAKDQPTIPLMCSEYWSGWFDHWGRAHATRSVENMCGSMKDMLDRKISFSLYMAHGGTTFGQWGGANTPPYSTMLTSYDYDAPISEAGWETEKFHAVRKLLGNYLNEGESIPESIPAAKKVISIPQFKVSEVAPLFDNLPKAVEIDTIQPMELFDQGWGTIIYRTTLPKGGVDRMLVIDEVHDWAIVYVGEQEIGRLDRRKGETKLILPITATDTELTILVEAMGRVNFGSGIIDRKGITEKVTVADGNRVTELKGWKVYNLPVDYKSQSKKSFTESEKSDKPAWYRGTFNIEEVGDTFLDVSTWGKGMVWVNGHNLGRFWEIGPQQTLYMPGCWMKEGDNEIIILDLASPENTTVEGLKTPILNTLHIEESPYNRKATDTLNLANHKPVKVGVFERGNRWQTIKFDEIYDAKYFCIEALSSFKNDGMSSIAELYLLDEKGKEIPRDKWRVCYADSEEVVLDNSDAEKVYDLQESTFWHTSRVDNKPSFPHSLVLDLGGDYKISGFKYLPRPQENSSGMIKDYNIYLSEKPFEM